MSNNSTPKNIKYVVGQAVYNVSPTDDIVNIDTSVTPVLVVLPNIGNAGLMLFRKQFFINDATGNALVNNITIIAAGGIVNSGQLTVININSGSSIASIVDINEYQVSTDSVLGGGTVTGADNGLSLNINTVELGGALITPTTITTDSTNRLDITDSFGNAFSTRDGAGNWGLATQSTNINSSYVNDYISGGNTYDSSLIIVNFGSVKTFTGATDCWTFGDYGTFTNSNQTFSFGRFTTLTSAIASFTIGDYNTIEASTTIFAIGNSNSLNIGTTTNIFGTNNVLENVTNSFVLGNNNLLPTSNFNTEGLYNFGDSLSLTTTANITSVVNIGFVNTLNLITPSAGIYIVGDSNSIIDSCDYTLLFGESVTVTRSDHSFIFGIYHQLTDSSAIWAIGESHILGTSSYILVQGNSNTINDVNNSTIIGITNQLDNSSYVSIFGNYNFYSGISSKTILGDNGLNLIVDEFGNIGNLLTMTSKLHIDGLLEFTDNADALLNSLTIGAFYRTGDLVKVVH
jgi:hypothetical protein